MSIPSTMTATLPPHSPHMGYQSNYNTNPASFAVNNPYSTGSSRIPQSYSFPLNTPASISRTHTGSNPRLPTLSSAMATSQSTSVIQSSRNRDRQPDWDEFYKNGLPEEVIVIDDDSPPPQSRKENKRPAPAMQQVPPRGEPTSKKRRMAYDAARDLEASYSHARTYSNGDSFSNTISTDRTTSLQTTAPTSLGSSHGSAGVYADDGQVGQKRKRVTRLQTADDKKRKELEMGGDAFSAYVPPPKPPIKARDVHVPSVKDVRLVAKHFILAY